MASIHKQVALEVAPAEAWTALRQIGDAHRVFAPVLDDSHVDGDVRTVRFGNGMIVNERIVDIDDERRRVAYSATDVPGMTYHHASMQVIEADGGRCQFVWVTDFLPAEMGGSLAPLIEQGCQALKRNLEKG
jgi:hypothetical protein